MSRARQLRLGIADQLREVYKPHQYGGVILPFTILRRLDCNAPGRNHFISDIAQWFHQVVASAHPELASEGVHHGWKRRPW